MRYVTIYDAAERNEVAIIKNLLEQHEIEFRVFDEFTNDAMPIGVRVQVMEEQEEKAKEILQENGFMGGRPDDNAERVTNTRFWIYLFLALLSVVIVAILINWFMNPA